MKTNIKSKYHQEYYLKNKEKLDKYRMDYYYRNKNHLDEQAKEYRKRTRSPNIKGLSPAYCYSCERFKPVCIFKRVNEEKSKGICKKCFNKKQAKYPRNKEKLNEYYRNYYYKNREKILATQKAYRERKKLQNNK
jgi:hypothetical protein